MGQEVGAAVVAREADPSECGGHERIAAHQAHVAGQCQRHACAGGGTRKYGQRGLGHFEQLAGGGALIDALAMNGLIDGVGANSPVATGGHAFDVAASTKAFAGAGQHDAFDVMIELGLCQLLLHGLVHFARHGIARIGSVHGERENAVVKTGQKMLGTCVEGFCLAHEYSRTVGCAGAIMAGRALRNDSLLGCAGFSAS